MELAGALDFEPLVEDVVQGHPAVGADATQGLGGVDAPPAVVLEALRFATRAHPA